MLVGHSYGGAVMTGVDAAAGDVVGLVHVASHVVGMSHPAEVAGAVLGATDRATSASRT